MDEKSIIGNAKYCKGLHDNRTTKGHMLVASAFNAAQ